VNRVATAEDLPEAASQFARELATLPTVAVGYMKKNLNKALAGSLSDVLDSEAIHMIRTFDTEDHKGAAVAFVEKRSPEFTGK
jgi:2-(1,2-epoxy-1,2-dihydrophenyl)acetyl-CoA isomerase